MPEIICIEVTNRCNLDCVHCNKLVNQHPIRDIPVDLVDSILEQARPFSPRVVALTGGEPTTHKQFDELIATIARHDIGYTLVTNGQNFRDSHKVLLRHSNRLLGVTFSLEGATSETNDSIRGPNTFNRVMDALELCRRHGLSFGLQTVLSTRNVGEMDALVELAVEQGADQLNFILMRPAPRPIEDGLILDMEAAEAAEKKIAELRKKESRIKVDMTTGYFSPQPLYACRPLGLSIISIDYNGYLRFCPDISNYRGAGGAEDDTDVIADLAMRPLQWSLKALSNRIALFWQNKIDYTVMDDLAPTDYFPCFYCLRYFNKADCLDV
ncbi:radical SAM protein [bacterium CPR1]|nr:radical SAM protein [bacterium CPR1]